MHPLSIGCGTHLQSGFLPYIYIMVVTVLPYQSEFYTACVTGDLARLSSLIDTHRDEISTAATGNFSNGVSLPVTPQGQTLLHIACINAHADVVPFLLDLGCDPSIW